MGENTGISWADNTFNPWWGCAKQSPACRFCYADRDSKRWGMQIWGVNAERRMMSNDTWRKPLKWNREAAASGKQVRVFCASMADVFDEHPACVEPRRRLWNLIEDTPALTWMLLTKRPQHAAAMVPDAWERNGWPGHVWCGVSAETQRFADERIPILLGLNLTVRFVSAAPQLGPLNVRRYLGRRPAWGSAYPEPTSPKGILVQNLLPNSGVAWVITEGESGPKARPSHPAWFRSVRDQCIDAGVAYHHKQWGEHTPIMPTIPDQTRPDGKAPNWNRAPDAWVCQETGKVVRLEADVPDVGSWQAMWRVGKKAAGAELDGQMWQEFPDARPAGVR